MPAGTGADGRVGNAGRRDGGASSSSIAMCAPPLSGVKLAERRVRAGVGQKAPDSLLGPAVRGTGPCGDRRGAEAADAVAGQRGWGTSAKMAARLACPPPAPQNGGRGGPGGVSHTKERGGPALRAARRARSPPPRAPAAAAGVTRAWGGGDVRGSSTLRGAPGPPASLLPSPGGAGPPSRPGRLACGAAIAAPRPEPRRNQLFFWETYRCRFSFAKRKNSTNIQNGKGEDPHQHRCHRPRRFWQVHHHRPPHLQMWGHRQEDHREVREGSGRGAWAHSNQQNSRLQERIDP